MISLRYYKRKRREKELEDNIIWKRFDLSLETQILDFNLKATSNDSGFYEYLDDDDLRYVSVRLKEKANLIRMAYSDGEYDEMAEKFDNLSQKIHKNLESKLANNYSTERIGA